MIKKSNQVAVAKRGILLRACLLTASVSALCLGGTVHAAIVQVNSSDNVNEIPVSSTDLINQGQATLLSYESTSPATYFGGSFNVLNNGVGGGSFIDAASDAANPFTLTYNFNTSVNEFGYDITGIDTYAVGFGFAGISWQRYEILYSVVGSNNLISLGTFTNNDTNNYYTKIALTSDSGPIASNVDQIQFVLDAQSNPNGTGWTELDVIGVASVPEPSIGLLLAAASFGLLALRRNRSALALS